MLPKFADGGVIISSFQTILCWNSLTKKLYLAELGDFPQEEFVTIHQNDFVIRSGDREEFVQHCGDIMYPGGAGRLAFFKDGLFLTGRPDGSVEFSATTMDTWEKFDCLSIEAARGKAWRPPTPAGGTELTLAGLKARIGFELDNVDLQLNLNWRREPRTKPRIVWIHHDINPSYDPLGDPELISEIDKFVFVSNWQKARFVKNFDLDAAKCCVIYNGININEPGIQWQRQKPWRFRCAYISDPGRGLDTLIRAWRKLDPENAELHIWSGTRLWGHDVSDSRYYHLFAEAADTRGVIYHGIAENHIIREALLEMHFLLMPSSFLETFCISAVEAMASGCRIVAPAIGALPEVVGKFGYLYDYIEDKDAHASSFATIVDAEFRTPWQGDINARVEQLAYVKEKYSWDVIQTQWLELIANIK